MKKQTTDSEAEENDDLEGFAAPTDEQARALKDGFAAHVATNTEFKQAVKGLMRTQNPRGPDAVKQFITLKGPGPQSQAAPGATTRAATDGDAANGSASKGGAAEGDAEKGASESDAGRGLDHPTLRVSHPFGSETAVEAGRERAPDAALMADVVAAPERQPEGASRGRGYLYLGVALALGLVAAILLWALSGPSGNNVSVPTTSPPDLNPTSARPEIATSSPVTTSAQPGLSAGPLGTDATPSTSGTASQPTSTAPEPTQTPTTTRTTAPTATVTAPSTTTPTATSSGGKPWFKMKEKP